ncbi:BatA and WFA domain-containing protein [Stieleria sp. JC731]|uniref:vWA domain-containing protein n=1 Tax=Pirellulaceae TaxID=2691357 RepID=UPI001E2B7D82|nr:BatA and WFA domain-containing protein [Stieleria sp. JC731]MCC9599355.1 BatA and WFA domain-containing protein [Stieleria sp. JC731]
MSFASPDKLIWLLVALPIIVFYILKTRLRRRTVSTLLFWEQIFEQKRQRSLWQNLRHWVSLLLQLAFVAFLGFALADPLWNSQEDRGQDLILVVDNSASMGAVDPETGTTRLDAAISQASDMASTLRNGDNIALITAGTSVRVVVGMSDFAPTVVEAIDKIRLTDGPTQVKQAVAAARRLASDPERRRIVIFTDGGITNRDLFAEKTSSQDVGSEDTPAGGSSQPSENESSERLLAEDVRVIAVGKSLDNVAITTFQVRRSTVDPIGYSLLVVVENFSENPADARLTLKLNDDLVDVIPMSIEPGESFRKQIDATSQAGGVLTGQLKDEDALMVDNTARAILPDRPEIPVRLVVGSESESFYLNRILESIPLVRIVTEEEADQPKLHIFAATVPETIPDGPVLFVDIPQDGPKLGDASEPAWQIGEAMENPIIAKQEKSSPLLRHVQLQNVILAGGRDIEVNENLGTPTTLLETATGAKVCVSVERESGRILLLASDLDTSDLPLRIAFPVLMTNAMNWFFRETGEIRPALTTGIAADVPWDIGNVDETVMATMISPSGDSTPITVKDGFAKLGALEHVGVYRLSSATSPPGTEADDSLPEGPEPKSPEPDSSVNENESASESPAGERVAVNLTDPNESDLAVPEFSDESAAPLPPASRSPWFYLVLAACGLVIAEWALFQRRVVA